MQERRASIAVRAFNKGGASLETAITEEAGVNNRGVPSPPLLVLVLRGLDALSVAGVVVVEVQGTGRIVFVGDGFDVYNVRASAVVDKVVGLFYKGG